ncbi:CubicO group peptidase, beta-lactamase class C family [Mucilaginibacter lappiensis]|uniref:CubicO group peptidase (Beta-lactamase class C family) n=1 Tax=Mucilaginibacter lappiensis TaxID=354630 RepID=A0ABR6PFV4_9SPHI|nr:serine hydrolase [Mucilaginibacter lappiensis]MBB6108639.1 CubicO group peptidase (beta-lactamase class C family) [Mucilaginibacter lappiensis]SIQ29802.1 CubicO group peptidase, beta-lactamase class C family [Mucilaginibacter lappiensis]
MKNLAIALLAVLLFTRCSKDKTVPFHPTNPDGFESGSFEEANIDKNRITGLEKEVLGGKYNIHSILILRHDKLIYEHYFAGEDAVFPNPVGRVEHTRDSLHDCRSVTKSIVSTCVGIAIGQGKIKSINDNIFDYFPAYKKYATGAKAGLTIKDLLTMSAGLEWNEHTSYTDPANGERQMLAQSDVVDFVLSRTAVTTPGTVFNYSGGCTQLLAQLVQKVTGIPINLFAAKNLFTPLGIQKFNWSVREDGTVWAPSGLRLRPIDMLKIGQLYMHGGIWNNQQILSADWVNQAMKWRINTNDIPEGYGYQFWCAKPLITGRVMDVTLADGNGGQIICMAPSLDLEVVLTAGNYNEDGDTSYDVLLKYIFAAVQK